MDAQDRIEDLLILSMMTAGTNLPVTSVPVFMNAAAFPANGNLVPLYRNTYDRVIALRVRGLNFAGGDAQLSIENSATGIIDTLTPVVKRTSDTIWLVPLQTLYIGYNVGDPAPTGSFSVLLFDPLVALKK